MSIIITKWKTERLYELVENPQDDIVDGPFGSRLKATEYVDEGIPIVRLQNIDRNRFIDKNIKFITKKKAREIARHHFVPGDILISKLGNPLGEACIAPDYFPYGILVADVVRVRPNKGKVDNNFLAYALNSSQVAKQFEAETKGTTRPRVNLKRIRNLEIPFVDSLDEQRRIVGELEKQFTSLEAGVAALKRVQANLKRYRAAVLKAACEGRLVPTEADLARKEGHPYETGEQLLTRILIERRQKWQGRGKYKETAAPNIETLQPAPEGWTWATVEQLAAIEPNAITDGPFGSNLKTEHYTNFGPRVIRLQNIGEGFFTDEKAHISDAHFARLQKHRVFGNDIVIAGLGENPPRACLIPPTIGPAIVKADCIRFKPHEDIAPKYMNIVLNSDPVRKLVKNIVHGVGRPRLNLGEVKAIGLPLPPLAEQRRIVAEVERRLSAIEEQEATVTASLQRAARLRQSILERAFSGRLIS